MSIAILQFFLKFYTKEVTMKKIPDDMCFEGFYIWFNSEKKEEYILTPNFLLGELENVNKEDFLKLKFISRMTTNSIADYELKNEEVSKWPFIRFTPYVEKLGLMLIRFLNTDFSDFINSYDNFYYAYGIELLEQYSKSFKFKDKYSSEKLLLDDFKDFHKHIKNDVSIIQKDFKDAINFLYNLNGNDEYKNNTTQSKFIASIIKRKTNLYKYINNTNIINYTYSDKAEDYKNSSFDTVLSDLSYDISMLKVSNIYTSNELGDILFIVLSQLIQNNDTIRTCQNCGRYFIPNKLNEIYCDFLHKDGTTCRDKGAGQTYKKNLQNIPGLLEYRRTYNKKFNAISRNKEDTKLKENFDKWKKSAQAEIKKFKQNIITDEELYNWMINHK